MRRPLRAGNILASSKQESIDRAGIMPDVATIRRRRLEALAATSTAQPARPQAQAKEARPPQKSAANSGANADAQEAPDSIIPSEFECILCLR